MGDNSGPGYRQYPNHRVTTEPVGVRVRVILRGEVLAESTDAVQMQETMEGSTVAPKVYYIPRQDVRMERLARSTHHTYCPFKGEASYFSLTDGPENLAWSYETPYDEMAAIREHLSFYPDKVDSIAVGG